VVLVIEVRVGLINTGESYPDNALSLQAQHFFASGGFSPLRGSLPGHADPSELSPQALISPNFARFAQDLRRTRCCGPFLIVPACLPHVIHNRGQSPGARPSRRTDMILNCPIVARNTSHPHSASIGDHTAPPRTIVRFQVASSPPRQLLRLRITQGTSLQWQAMKGKRAPSGNLIGRVHILHQQLGSPPSHGNRYTTSAPISLLTRRKTYPSWKRYSGVFACCRCNPTCRS